MEDDGPIVRINVDLGVLAKGDQIPNGRLHLLQQIDPGPIVEQVNPRHVESLPSHLHVIEVVKLSHEVPTLAAPRGEQRVTVRMHVLQG